MADTTEYPDHGDDVPSEWGESAQNTYKAITEDHPDLDVSALASLWHACSLEAAADRLDAQVRDDGVMIPGSAGQMVLHPACAESRQARVAAVAALKALGLAIGQSSASAAGARLAQKRWSGRSLRAVDTRRPMAPVTDLAQSRADVVSRLKPSPTL